MITKTTSVALTFFFGAAFLFSCQSETEKTETKKAKPDYFAIEEKTIDSTIKTNPDIKNYVAAKSIIRALGAEEDQRPDFLKEESYTVAQKYIFTFIAGETPDMAEAISDIPALLQFKDMIENAPDAVYELDESNYPTILNSVSRLSGIEMPVENWNGAYESMILATTVKYSELSPSVAMYEFRSTNFQEIRDNELRALAQLYYALIFMDQDLPYHANKYAAQALSTIESADELSGSFTRSVLMESESDPSTVKQNFKGLCHLVIALAYDQMTDADDRKEAVEHFKTFIATASEQKPGSEWQILSEAVSLLMENQNEEAYNTLKVLTTSSNLSGSEKLEIGKLFRKDEKVDLSDFIRNSVITGIVAEKLFTYLLKSDMYEQLSSNKIGKALFDLMPNLDEYAGQLKTLEKLGSF